MEARAFNDRIVAATLKAGGGTLAGGGEIDIPDPDQAITAFDEALAAEPSRVNTEEEALLRGLGLRGR